MSSFSQWRTNFVKTPKVRQVTYLCGTEPVLIEDVLATIRDTLRPEPWNHATFVAGEDSERIIWAEADQHPSGSGPHLVVVRNAERLKQTDRLIEWVATRTMNPRTYLVLISNEGKIPRLTPTEEERRLGARAEMVPHLAALSGKGHIIECRPYTMDSAKHAVSWVQTKVGIRQNVAEHLLERSNGDLRLVRDVCRKLAAFGQDPSIPMVNELLAQRPRDTFTDALIALDKKAALLALESLPVSLYYSTLGLLDSRLDLAGTVHDLQGEQKTLGEIARRVGPLSFLVKDVAPVAKHYDAKRRLAIRQLLAVADEALRGGATVGVMEALVVFF